MIIIEAYKNEIVVNSDILEINKIENTRIAVINIEFLDKDIYNENIIVKKIRKLLKGKNKNIWIQELESVK